MTGRPLDRFEYFDATFPEELALVSAAHREGGEEDLFIIVTVALLARFVLSLNL